MKNLNVKFLSGAAVLGLMTQLSFAQPIADNVVIPVAVTINTTMRINVVSGGNIEFVVNTIEDYETGIANGPTYDTRFTVASSVDFDVRMYAEDATFIGTDVSTAGGVNTLPLNNVGYLVTANGNHVDATEVTLPAAILPLTNVAATDIVTNLLEDAGGTDDNDFTISWELATPALIAVTAQETLLKQDIAQDRYITNVFLVLEAD